MVALSRPADFRLEAMCQPQDKSSACCLLLLGCGTCDETVGSIRDVPNTSAKIPQVCSADNVEACMHFPT